MRLAINLILSLGMLALCTWLVWPDAAAQANLRKAVDDMHLADFLPYLAAYLGLQVIVHLCRSLRWNHLLAPLGVRVPVGPLLAISSVGFMAILAFPARLGEFVRPGLLRKGKYTTAAAALGTVAVERIVDGFVISLLVFCAFVALHSAHSPWWMMPTAYVALVGFAGFMVFLVFAMRRPRPTVAFCMSLTLLPRFAPRFAERIAHWAIDMIRGFAVLKDVRNLTLFLVWSVVYWTANGLGVWVLAHAFHLPLSLVGAYATMGLLGFGLLLPNSPGLVGQFEWFTLLGMSLYLGFDPNAPGPHALAFAIAQHLLQVAWYVAMGALGLASPWVSFHDLWSARKVTAADDAESVEPAGKANGAMLEEVPLATTEARKDKMLTPEARAAAEAARVRDQS